MARKNLAELKAMSRFGWAIFKGLFHRKTVYYRCSECNLVISLNQKACDRCDTLIEWE